MGMVLRRSILEIKAVGTIKLEEFIKLFHPTPKTELLINILDNEAKKRKRLKDLFNKNKKRDTIANICNGILTHSKELIAIYKQMNKSISDGEKYVLDKELKLIKSSIVELYSLTGFKYIDEFSKNYATQPECALLVDKGIKKLIKRELALNMKKDISSFPFPHEFISDHYVIITLF